MRRSPSKPSTPCSSGKAGSCRGEGGPQRSSNRTCRVCKLESRTPKEITNPNRQGSKPCRHERRWPLDFELGACLGFRISPSSQASRILGGRARLLRSPQIKAPEKSGLGGSLALPEIGCGFAALCSLRSFAATPAIACRSSKSVVNPARVLDPGLTGHQGRGWGASNKMSLPLTAFPRLLSSPAGVPTLVGQSFGSAGSRFYFPLFTKSDSMRQDLIIG